MIIDVRSKERPHDLELTASVPAGAMSALDQRLWIDGNLSVDYGGVHALRGVSVGIPDRSVVSIIGANGAGKSTLMKSIAGQVRPGRHGPQYKPGHQRGFTHAMA